MRLQRFAGYLTVTVAAAALTTWFFGAVHSSAITEKRTSCAAIEAEPLGVQAPDFSLVDLSGKKQSLSGLRGKVVLLNFWATWCPPCVEELPDLARLPRQIGSSDFALLTVNVDEDAATLRTFLERHRATLGSLPILLDPEKRVSRSFGTEKYPETFLIDRQGIARYKIIYKRDWAAPAALACLRSLL